MLGVLLNFFALEKRVVLQLLDTLHEIRELHSVGAHAVALTNYPLVQFGVRHILIIALNCKQFYRCVKNQQVRIWLVLKHLSNLVSVLRLIDFQDVVKGYADF